MILGSFGPPVAQVELCLALNSDHEPDMSRRPCTGLQLDLAVRAPGPLGKEQSPSCLWNLAGCEVTPCEWWGSCQLLLPELDHQLFSLGDANVVFMVCFIPAVQSPSSVSHLGITL